MNQVHLKILITGAPSSGKSTTLSRLAHVFGHRAIIVPESARLLLLGGFPVPNIDDIVQIRAFQKAILGIQKNIEAVLIRQNPTADLMIYDRGAVDGAGFWPLTPENFLEEFKIDITKEYAHYDYVLFFEMPDENAYGGITPLRFHNFQQSLESEKRLRKLWGKHSNFIEIKATAQLEDKIQTAIAIIKNIANLK